MWPAQRDVLSSLFCCLGPLGKQLKIIFGSTDKTTVSMYRGSSDSVSQDASSGFQKELGNLDRAVALERVGGDLQLLQEIAQMFLDSVPELMGDMRAALSAGDARALERAAHTLKGCVCNFGAEAAYEGARNLEMIGHAGDLRPAQAAFRELETAIDRLCPALAELGAPSQP